ALRRLRFSRNAAPRRRCWLAFCVHLGRSSMAGKIRGGASGKKAHGRADATPGGDRPPLAPLWPLWQGSPHSRPHLFSNSHPARRCRSSVVEHSLGKGEVVSSILP